MSIRSFRSRFLTFSLAILSFMILSVFLSCHLIDEQITLTLRFDDSISKSALLGRGLIGSGPDSDTIYSPGYGNDIDHYDITFTGPGDNSISLSDISGSSYDQKGLIPGTWSIDVIAYDADDHYRGEGSTEVTLASGESKDVEIEIGFYGTCDLEISVIWPEVEFTDLQFSGSITKDYGDSGSSEHILSFSTDTDTRTASAALSDIEAGVYFLELELSDGDQLLWGRYPMMYLDKGTSTTCTHDLTADDIRLKAIDLTLTSVLPERWELELVTEYLSSTPVTYPIALELGSSSVSPASVSLSNYSWLVNGRRMADYDNTPLPASVMDADGSYDIVALVNISGDIYSTGRRITISDTPRVRDLDTSFDFRSNFVIGTEGAAVSWGNDINSETNFLLHASPGDTFIPEQVTSSVLSEAEEISVGNYAGLALVDGRLFGWGNNFTGVIGNGTMDNPDTLAETSLPESRSVRSFSVGKHHVLAVTDDFRLYGWGYNDKNCLNDSEETKILTPSLLHDSVSFIDVAGGEAFSLAVSISSDVYAWGVNSSGECGTGSYDSSPVTTPTKITTLDDITIRKVYASSYMSFAVSDDGDLYTWGYNLYGPLGDGVSNKTHTPVKILSGGVEEVACGDSFAIARKSDGSVWAWGDNKFGQLATGNYVDASTPVEILEDIEVYSIYASAHTAYAETASGLYCWGKNDQYQSGLGYHTPLVWTSSFTSEGGLTRPRLVF